MNNQYLCRKSNPKIAHLWNEFDTECRMYSTGGLNKKKYALWKTDPRLPICTMCSAVWERDNAVPK